MYSNNICLKYFYFFKFNTFFSRSQNNCSKMSGQTLELSDNLNNGERKTELKMREDEQMKESGKRQKFH